MIATAFFFFFFLLFLFCLFFPFFLLQLPARVLLLQSDHAAV